MSCCGSKRQQVVQGSYRASVTVGKLEAMARPAHAHSEGVLFVYDGLAELIVIGSDSGRRYRFAQRGARLWVSQCDAAAFDEMPRLRRLIN
jgi:uncharacterized protein YjhX (UPF0386 family)